MRENRIIGLLREINNIERSLGLYHIKVFNVPLWRLVRFQVRSEKLKKETGFVNRTTEVKLNIFSLLQNYVKSFFQLIDLILKAKKYRGVIFAFPRLVKHNGEYLDKFTDPIIEQTALKNQVLVVQRNLSGQQLKPRRSESADIIMSDFVDYSSKLLAIVLLPLFYLIYHKEINDLYKKASKYFSLNNKFKLFTCFKVGEFYIQINFWNRLFSSVGCNNVFIVNREIYFPQSVSSKTKAIKVYELQHGITHSETVLYAGDYQEAIDPDFFLTFGEKWVGEQFAMPLDRIKNIGWAYGDWMSEKKNCEVDEKSILVVSSPAITEQILRTVSELAEMYVDYEFTLRLHPQEAMTDKQLLKINNYRNIIIDDKDTDSMLAVLSHKFCIGENSSVLYEALSFGINVGKINYNGLSSKRQIDDEIYGFYYIDSNEDFAQFLRRKEEDAYVDVGIYNKFDPLKFEKIIDEK